MKRADDGSGESLELLLDTICNMFGTIIFVALIAALLALTSSRTVHHSSEDVVASERDRVMTRLRTTADELDLELAKYPAAPDVDVDADAVERTTRALGEIKRRRDLIKQYSSALEISRTNLDLMSEQVGPLREEIERIDAALKTAESASSRKMRTPLERELGLNIFVIVVWQDRLYPVCDWTTRNHDPCERLRQWSARFVVASQCSTPRFQCDMSGLDIERRIMLREGAGIPMESAGALRANGDFTAMLATLDPTKDLIGFMVAPDSFDSFAMVKEEVLRAGFNYNVEPYEARLPLYIDSWVQGISRAQ
ncbi:MAG: hypothetical protein DWI10_03265 [Planctomycetota bacterium]|nr:MAG: hypothetical protein DWI10_03265 [Planctomycetota bacterium]